MNAGTNNPHALDGRFTDFIRNSQLNRIYFWAAISISITLFFIFKIFDPYPNMVMDSYVYVKAMALNMGANSFPIGYSKFLQLVSLISHSATLLVWVQYLFLETTCLLFFFTILFFFRPGKVASSLLFVFLFLNPILFYISNFIMADTLFTTLSLLWVTQLIWIIGRPRSFMILTHALLLLFVFTVRYNALYYPFIASLVLIFCRFRLWQKVAVIGLQFALIGAFILYTQGQMKELTGIKQFSPFGGWKLANNALYMYGHVCQKEEYPIPARFGPLDSMVRGYFSKVPVGTLYNFEESSIYMSYRSPLFYYMNRLYGQDNTFQNFKKWGPLGVLYGEYGSYLLHTYPLGYAQYFMGPNFYRYWFPPTEIFSSYSPYFLREDDLGQIASRWYGLKTLTISPVYMNFRTRILSLYPLFIALAHFIFLLGLFGFILFKGFRKSTRINSFIIIVIAITWLCDLGFNVFASEVVLRYLLFVMILEISFSLLFVDYIWNTKEQNPLGQPRA